MQQLITAMEKRGFMVVSVQSADEAKRELLARILPSESVGVGGSVSVRETGVLEAMKQRGQTLYDHWACQPEESIVTRQSAMLADVYLCSCNAITKDGRLVYIDGNGNRVGAVAYGPKRLFIIVGENKLVNGGLEAAIARIKRESCPPNAIRLSRDTPCAKTGTCQAAQCKQSMCNMTFSLDGRPKEREIIVLLVSQKLGY